MELLEGYESEVSSSTECEETLSALTESVNAVCSVYLLTYSQSDTVKFPCRRDFTLAVVTGFSQGKGKVIQWCCCKEQHTKTSGEHYRIAVKLDRNQRWLPCKEYLQREHGISVHFSNKHANYVTKSDPDFEQSPRHPFLNSCGEPKTSSASRARLNGKWKRGPRLSTVHDKEVDHDDDDDDNRHHFTVVAKLPGLRMQARLPVTLF